MTQKSTDLHPRGPRDVAGEHASKAVAVLRAVAAVYASERPDALVDELDFPVRVGATAYELAGRSCHGGGQNVSRLALRMAPPLKSGVSRGVFAAELSAVVAVELGHEWPDGDNDPVIPRLPVPGPRRSDEAGRVPLPRRGRCAGRH